MVFLVTIGLGKTNGVEKPELKTPPPQEVKPVETPAVNVPPPPPVVVYNPMARKAFGDIEHQFLAGCDVVWRSAVDPHGGEAADDEGSGEATDEQPLRRFIGGDPEADDGGGRGGERARSQTAFQPGSLWREREFGRGEREGRGRVQPVYEGDCNHVKCVVFVTRTTLLQQIRTVPHRAKTFVQLMRLNPHDPFRQG